MGLPHDALTVIAPYLDGDVLSLGYPDITATKEQVKKLFNYEPTRFIDLRERHGGEEESPDTEELFEHTGGKLTVVDCFKERGIEIVADLNYPHDLGKFDLVIDPGTCEHCFNIGQALFNAANAVKVGGRILHISPMNMLNHGFYNLCPTLFADLYSQNNWSVELLAARIETNMQPHAYQRFHNFYEHTLMVVAMRATDAELKFPTQRKYLRKE